jgi:predicted ATPase
MPSFKFGIKKSALGNLPADETKFPAANWLKNYLTEGVQLLILDSLKIRQPSPPGQSKQFKPDGSNLPWVIDDLKKDVKRFNQWLDHIKTALPDIEDIVIVERPEDKHKYLCVNYSNGGKIPSWLVSDGTLRLFALTIPAYLRSLKGVFLIEEPENGIHPKAIESVYQSLSSVYAAQILLASHSPIILSMVKPSDVLCFAKTPEGVTDIVTGSEHPKLRDWRGTVNLSDLFAGGVLG